MKCPPFPASGPSAAQSGLAWPLRVRCPASPHPPLSPRYKDLHPSLFSHFSLHLSFTSPCRLLAPSRIARICATPPGRLAGFCRPSPIVMLWPLHEAFCWWPFPSGSLCCTFHPRQLLTCPLSPTAEASDKGEPCHSLPRILSPALQLSSALNARRWFLFRPCWSASSLGSTGLDLSASAFLCQPLFHHRSADLRLCDDIGGKFQLAASIPGRSNCLTRRQLPHGQWKKCPLTRLPCCVDRDRPSAVIRCHSIRGAEHKAEQRRWAKIKEWNLFALIDSALSVSVWLRWPGSRIYLILVTWLWDGDLAFRCGSERM